MAKPWDEKPLWWKCYMDTHSKVYLHSGRIIGHLGCGGFAFYDAAKLLPFYDKLRFEKAAEPIVPLDQLGLDLVLLVGHRAGDRLGLAAFELGPWQVEHLSRLHVGEAAEHLHEFRQVDELGETAAGLEGGAKHCAGARRRFIYENHR